MEPWQSWLAAVVVGGGLFYYYSRGDNTANKSIKTPQTVEQPQASTSRRRQGKQATKAQETVSNITEKAKELAAPVLNAATNTLPNTNNTSKKRKAGKESVADAPAPPVAKAREIEEEEVEHDDIKDWAAQLDARKKGVSLDSHQPTAKAQSRQNTAVQRNGATETASTSSMAHMDGLSSETPNAATTNGLPRAGGDVSDMLEARGAVPSVMRIVGEQKPKKQQAPRTVSESAETKKQRQNKKKVEEQRLIREEQEKERQLLLEKQRRTAREARGEPAKNGLSTGPPPSSNAWSAGPLAGTESGTNGVTSNSKATGVQLLDTFDPDMASTASSNELLTNNTTPATAVSAVDQDLPSEETQLEMLNEMNGWNEVAKVKKGKRKAQPQAGDSTIADNKSESATVPQSKPVLVAPKAAKQPMTNGYAALEHHAESTPGVKGHPDDSDWL